MDTETAKKIHEEVKKHFGSEFGDLDPEIIKLTGDVSEMLSTGKMTLREAFDLPQEKLDLMYAIAYDLYSNDKYEKASMLFNALCVYEPLKVDYWLGLGATKKMLKEYEHAVIAYHSIISLRPTMMSPYLDMAECLLKIKQVDAAKKFLAAVVEIGKDKELAAKNSDASECVLKAKTLLELLNQSKEKSKV